MPDLRWDVCPACQQTTLAPVPRDPFDSKRPDPKVTARACLNSECLAVQELQAGKVAA
jgi:hypothetical protein